MAPVMALTSRAFMRRQPSTASPLQRPSTRGKTYSCTKVYSKNVANDVVRPRTGVRTPLVATSCARQGVPLGSRSRLCDAFRAWGLSGRLGNGAAVCLHQGPRLLSARWPRWRSRAPPPRAAAPAPARSGALNTVIATRRSTRARALPLAPPAARRAVLFFVHGVTPPPGRPQGGGDSCRAGGTMARPRTAAARLYGTRMRKGRVTRGLRFSEGRALRGGAAACCAGAARLGWPV